MGAPQGQLSPRQAFYRQTYTALSRWNDTNRALMVAAGHAARAGTITEAQGQKARNLGIKSEKALRLALDALESYIIISDQSEVPGQDTVFPAIAEAAKLLADLSVFLAQIGVKT